MNHDRADLRLNRRALLVLALAAMVSPAAAQQTSGDPDAVYDELLKRYVVVGKDGVNRVHYGRWQANAADLKALDDYIIHLSARRPSTMARNERYTYWANLYNAVTLKVVLDRYPVASIRDIRSDSWFDLKAWTGPWRQPRVTVEGKRLSLDNIEHDTMRPTFKDPRVHYIVNCASYGCPNLMNRVWRAKTLEADLEAGARSFVNHSRGVAVLPSGDLRISSIYKWFIEDFGGTDAGILAHLRKYAAPNLARHLATSPLIVEYDYDWTLNNIAAARASN